MQGLHSAVMNWNEKSERRHREDLEKFDIRLDRIDIIINDAIT